MRSFGALKMNRIQFASNYWFFFCAALAWYQWILLRNSSSCITFKPFSCCPVDRHPIEHTPDLHCHSARNFKAGVCLQTIKFHQLMSFFIVMTVRNEKKQVVGRYCCWSNNRIWLLLLTPSIGFMWKTDTSIFLRNISRVPHCTSGVSFGVKGIVNSIQLYSNFIAYLGITKALYI